MPDADPAPVALDLHDDQVTRLREALTAADFTVGAVGDLLGPDAHRALQRNETTPAARRTGDGSPLATLTRLFSLQRPVDVASADTALGGQAAALTGAGLLERDGDQVRALVDVRPYGDEDHDWWVVSDLTPGLDGDERRVAPDWVLGVSEASSSLAQLTVRTPVASALDLGTGCGVQSLHLSSHVERVVGTDLNPRAVTMARLTAELNGLAHDVREGDLLAPVAGERFDLLVTNPPFVISPGTDEKLVYRDSGLPGDEVVRRIVTGAPEHLNPGGWCQVLANWVHRADQPWQERVEGWLAPGGCDAWALEREAVDPATYVEMWLADAGLRGTPDWTRRYDAWLSWFEAERIEAVGFGWLSLRAAGRDVPRLRVEEWPYEVVAPLGPHVRAWGERVDLVAGATDDEVLAAHLVRAPGLAQESVGEPGATDPSTIVLRLPDGVRRARQADTVEAALVGALDGDLAVGQVLDALATLTDTDVSVLRTTYLPVVRELVDEGYLR
ncbi:MAG: methyltransferase [Nocardioidaceae bacterium]|nr:methyltransferase [Nocardioidaceae bacterium]